MYVLIKQRSCQTCSAICVPVPRPQTLHVPVACSAIGVPVPRPPTLQALGCIGGRGWSTSMCTAAHAGSRLKGQAPERRTPRVSSRMVFRRKAQQKKHQIPRLTGETHRSTNPQPVATSTAINSVTVSERGIRRFSLSLWRSAEHHCGICILPQRIAPVGNPIPVEELITLCESIVDLAHRYGITSSSEIHTPPSGDDPAQTTASSHDTATEHDTENPQQDIPWWEDWSECDHLSN